LRILFVEDEYDLGFSVKKSLQQANYIVDWVMDGEEAWNYLENNPQQYTLAIFDWLLPNLSGLQLLQRLRQKGNNLPVLMLTAKDTMQDKITGLDAGADDYLVKPFGMAELLARLRALQRRSPLLTTQQLKYGNLILDYNTYTVTWSEQVITLTTKEFQLLEYFMKHPGQILTRDQILDHLWTWDSETISNVVAAQVRLLRKKLATFGADHCIETVYGLGYRFCSAKVQ
jgi:DNA-binding response OmpR family regulator